MRDQITAAGRASADNVTIATVGAETTVTGLPATLRIANADATDAVTDALVINTGAGDDIVNATALLTTGVSLSVDAGAGNDQIQGGAGADVLSGGAGNDVIDGNRGNDTAFMGDGNDLFVWDPGDGSDTIDGQAGFDTHEFNGSAANENISLAAGGNDVLLTRNVGNIVMTQDNVERVEIFAGDGIDNIEIGDLRGTDVREVVVDLALVADGTSGDGVRDTVTVNGSLRSEIITRHRERRRHHRQRPREHDAHHEHRHQGQRRGARRRRRGSDQLGNGAVQFREPHAGWRQPAMTRSSRAATTRRCSAEPAMIC